MKIERLHIDGFGSFNDKSITNFKEGVNVLYGKNEAGKSTLLDFIRFTLFGYPTGAGSLAKRRPPIFGGEHGGRIWMKSTPGEELMIQRKGDLSFSMSLNGIVSDNLKQYQQLIGNASADLYNNVYAITIDELLEVKQLTSSGMEDRIFSMGMGLSGVDFGGFERKLVTHTEDYYVPRGRTKIFDEIIKQLEEKTSKINELKSKLNDYNRLTEEAEELENSIKMLNEERQLVREKTTSLFNYKRSYPHFVAYQGARQKIAELGDSQEAPKQLMEDYRSFRSNLQALEKDVSAITHEIKQLEEQIAKLVINEKLVEHIHLLDYFKSTVKVYEEAQLNIQQANDQLHQAEQQRKEVIKRLGSAYNPDDLVKLEGLFQLRTLADEWMELDTELVRTISRQEDLLGELQVQSTQLKARKETARQELDKIGIGTDSQAKEKEQRRVELDTQLKKVLAGTVVQTSGKTSVYAGMAASILLILAGVFMLNWQIVVGIAFLVLGVLLFALIVVKQNKKNHQGVGGNANAINTELEQLKQQLASYEKTSLELKQLDREMGELDERIQVNQQRTNELKENQLKNNENWIKQLSKLNLPAFLKPRMIADFLTAVEELKRLSRQVEQTEQNKLRFEKVGQEFEDKLKLVQPQDDQFSLDEIYQLIDVLEKNAAAYEAKERLSVDLKKVQTNLALKREEQLSNEQQVEELFKQLKVKDEAALYQFFEHQEIVQSAYHTMESAATTIRSICGQDKLTEALEVMANFEPTTLEMEHATQDQKLSTLSEEYEEQVKSLAALRREIQHILQIDQMYGLMNEKEGLEAQLQEAGREWLATKMALSVLSDAKQKYEEEKQPEVITQTRDIFREITNEAYKDLRISLSERHVSLIDDQGRTKTVEELSRGTREQLLLALRMGLIAEYEKSAEALPVVLDDVMVNFDSVRSANLVKTLIHFAEKRQVIMFTCHEHTAEMFEKSGANVLGW